MKILYEDNHLIAVEKEAGTLTQSDSTGDTALTDMIKRYLREKYHKPGNVFLGMVQRLDKPVSGAILFAKTSKAAARISREIRSRSMIKIYTAVTEAGGMTPRDRWVELDQKIARKRGISEIVDEGDAGAREAKLNLHWIASSDRQTLILVRLLTGKKHQIRAQLSSMGTPIVGDVRYGSQSRCVSGRAICLHSTIISFLHPISGSRITVFSRPPEYFGGIVHPGAAFAIKIKEILAPVLPDTAAQINTE